MGKAASQYAPVILIGILFLALWLGAISVLVFHLQPPLSTVNAENKTPTVNIVLYAGEYSSDKMGFGLSPNNLTSPGPTLHLKTTDIVSVTIVNSGKVPHAFAVTDMPRSGANILFNAQVASATNPLEPGQQTTVVFTPNYAGSTFYYICPISGHAEAGMWGSVIVTG
jgi:uncharacterized cupredoxin-like copper-binding protein